MSPNPVGKTIFANRREYPLPKEAGTTDFIFYFVPAGDPYGKGARYFFDRFFKDHERRNVGSLQELISRLSAAITAQNIAHVREIVIVAHGTPRGLIFPVVDGVTNSNLTQYKYLTPGSLVQLQSAFEAGEFASFSAQRKQVIAKLTEDSWVTIRACNFGQSQPGLYAFYAFFGGRANVYAPKEYQFFGSHPILPGMRLETKLDVHQHLVKQRFLPRDVHTPDRKDAIVRFLADPAQFSDPVELMTVDLTDSGAPETIEFDDIVDKLNARRIADSLRARLSGTAQIALSGEARVAIRVADAAWVIHDILQHQGDEYRIEYRLFVQASPPDATLIVEATIPGMHSAREFFPLQLFFFEGQNAIWRGKLFSLAFHTEDPDADPANKVNFDAVLNLLNSGNISGGGVNLIVLFEEEGGIALGGTPTLTALSPPNTPDTERKTWALVAGSEEYHIRLEHPYSSGGIPAHTIIVYEHRDPRSRLKEEYELMSYLGEDPDQPGTELMAYLDNFSLDDLAALIRHLRDPYRPEHSVYIYHAIQAQARKRDYLKWYTDLPEVKDNLDDPLISTPYDMSYRDGEDRSELVYSFEPNVIWAEVKASNPPSQPFQDDLFTEQLLSFTAREREAPHHLEPDSPQTDIEELRQIESQGIERFFSTEKFTFQPEDAGLEDISCARFAQIITELKDLEGLSAAEIEQALDTIQIEGDKTLSYFLVNAGKSVLTALKFLNVIKGSGGIPETVVTIAIRRVPALGFAPAASASTPYLITITRALPYVGIVTFVGKMFTNFLAEYGVSLENWKEIGRRTAVRQWARALRNLTFDREDDFPATLDIDIGSNVVALYLQEQRDETMQEPIPFVRHPDTMQEGFDEGIELVEREAQEILDKSDGIVDASLYKEGLDACKIKVLRDEGIIDTGKTRAIIMRQYADMLLEKVPNV